MNLLRHLRSLFHRSRLDREMDEELRFHIEEQTRRNVASGMTPEEAARAARRQFGWADRIREEGREALGLRWLEDLARDVRFGIRMLIRNPVFTTVVVLTLALGVGATTAIFGVIHTHFLDPIPGANEDRRDASWNPPSTSTRRVRRSNSGVSNRLPGLSASCQI